MKIGKIIIIVSVCVVAAGLIFAAIGLVGAKKSKQGPFDESKRVEKTYESFSEIKALKIDDSNTDITLTQASGEKFFVTYTEDERSAYEIKENNSELVIERKNSKNLIKHLFDFKNERRVLTVAVPASFSGNIDADTDNGNITLELPKTQLLSSVNLETDNHAVTVKGTTISETLAAKTSNGSIKIDSCAIGKITAETNNGTVSLSSLSATGDIFCETDNGIITVCDTVCANLLSKTANGTIELSSVNALGTISCETSNEDVAFAKISVGKGLYCNCSNGSITGTVCGTLGDFSYKDCFTSNGECNLPKNVSGGEKEMAVSTSNGNIEVSFVSE